MTITLGLLIGGILAIAGLATYLFAPRLGPNPIFGVRIGYAFASREVWDKTNRFGGGLMMLAGLLTALLSLIIQFLNLDPATGIGVLTGLMLVALLGGVVWLTLYARNLANDTPLAKELAPVQFRWAYLTPVLFTFALLVAVTLWFYPQLPAARMATHFGFDDQPNGWMTRDGFVLSFLGLAALFVGLDAITVFIATREAVFSFRRWGDRWYLDPGRGLIFTGILLALANVILIIVMFDVGWFNTRGAHLFPLGWLILLIVPILAVVIGLFFLLGRRTNSADAKARTK